MGATRVKFMGVLKSKAQHENPPLILGKMILCIYKFNVFIQSLNNLT